MRHKYLILAGLALLALAFILAACGTTTEPTPCPTAAPCPDCPTCPEPPACPEPEPCPPPVVENVPFEDLWVSSGHADSETEAFRHWDEDDPPVVPESCAKCHTTTGYIDFIAADGSEYGVVDTSHDPAQGIQCIACHNDATLAMTSVVFPSGVEITGLGPEARCMQCHQGRASKVSVDTTLEGLGLTEDLDTVNEELGFINIHYYAAGATLYGTITKGGYEYDGKSYDFKNDHVAGYDTCVGCHNPHTLERKLDECAVCHTNVANDEDVRNIRMAGSLVDYDGDGDITEGVAFEIAGLQDLLLTAIQAYSSEVSGTPVVYDPARHPYFFTDANSDGVLDEGDTERYTSWTGRMLKAGYNYQTSLKDPGAFAHGGKYIIQLLYDSIEDLNTVLSTPIDLSNAHRIDAGHFAGSEEAFRHWDVDGEVPGGCAKCHSASGLPLYLKDGVNISAPLANGFNCATCHDNLSTFSRFVTDAVGFPSGAVLTFGEGEDANLCINCHQGRESTVSLNSAISRSGVGDDEISDALSFRNPHYFAAGATLFGTEAKGAYEFEGESYLGRNTRHPAAFQTCIQCHDAHALKINLQACSGCHGGMDSEEDLRTIRITAGDFDGDGDEAEGIAEEIATIDDQLYLAIQDYATNTVGTSIAFSGDRYPYWFIDANANSTVDPDEGDRYATWTPNLLRAAYNYTWVAKDPGAFAHNPLYIMQVLYDSIRNVGGDVSGITRPEVPAP
jgi:hypothetical protein